MTACAPSLYRVRQIFAAKETECGAPACVVTTSAIEVQVSPKIDIKTDMVENNIAKGSLTRTPQIPSTTSAEASFTAMLKGSGAAATEPSIGQYLEGCGLQKYALMKFTASAKSGTHLVGSTFTTVASDAGYLYWVDGNDFWVVMTTGTITSAEVLTFSNGATATATAAPVASGFSYRPESSGFQPLTIRLEEGGVITKEIFGALGSVSISSDSSNPAQAEFKFSGRVGKYYRVTASNPSPSPIPIGTAITWTGGGIGTCAKTYTSGDPYFVYTIKSGSPIASGNVITAGGSTCTASGTSYATIDSTPITSGVSFETTIPPILQCSDVVFGSLRPVIQNIGFDTANEVAMRQDLNSCDGYAPAIITARKPTLKVNPEAMSISEYDIYGQWIKGGLVNGTAIRWGQTSGNMVVLWVNQMQWQSVADGDRDGVSILDAEAIVTSVVSDWEFQLLFL